MVSNSILSEEIMCWINWEQECWFFSVRAIDKSAFLLHNFPVKYLIILKPAPMPVIILSLPFKADYLHKNWIYCRRHEPCIAYYYCRSYFFFRKENRIKLAINYPLYVRNPKICHFPIFRDGKALFLVSAYKLFYQSYNLLGDFASIH